MPVPDEHARGVNPDQYLAAADRRSVDVREYEVIRSAVLVLDDRLHRVPLTQSRAL